MYIINVEMTFGTRQSNAVRFFSDYAYLVDLSWLVWIFNKTQNVSPFFLLLVVAVVQGCVPCVSSHRNFVWSIVRPLLLTLCLCAYACACEYAYYTCVCIYALEYKHKKRSYFVKLCARNPIKM